MTIALALVAAYLVGSIDFAVVVSRMRGAGTPPPGGGGYGAIVRTLGRLPAALVLAGDVMKGVVAAAMGMVAAGVAEPQVHWAFAAGLAAVVGHCYPVFHRFKGGKGTATVEGLLLFTVPLVALINVVLWAVAHRLTRTPFAASLTVIVITIPLAIWQGVGGRALLWLLLAAALVVWRHRESIQRVLTRSERKVPT